MRRMLAGFLATSMIVAVASATTFAATSASAIVTLTDETVQPQSNSYSASKQNVLGKHGSAAGTDGTWQSDYTVEKVDISVLNSANQSIGNFTVAIGENGVLNPTTADVKDSSDPDTVDFNGATLSATSIASLVDGKTFADVNIEGVYYSGKLVKSGTAGLKVEFDKASVPNMASVKVDVTVTFSNATTDVEYINAGTTESVGTRVPITQVPKVVMSKTDGSPVNGNYGETADVDKAGDFDTSNIGIKDVLVCYPDGSPIPLTENPNGVDEDLNNDGGVQSGATVYFMIRDDDKAAFDRLEDDNFWKIKVSKGDNGKYVKEIKDTTKIFSKDLYDANKTKTIVPGTGGTRHRYIKLSLNEIYTDDEYKLTFDLRLSAQSKAVDAGIVKDDDTEIKIKDFAFWMKNLVKEADNDWKVGIGGLMLNPLENDWNEVTYYDEDGDLAFMKFFADSDVDKFYAKLSTKWEHADYASYFNDQDAFIFNFTGSPKLSSTSRADLQIYNPFVDEDGNETSDPTTAVIYQVIDGDLYDVTDSFEYKEGDNGDMAFCTRTRFLGTYIICEKAVEEAVADETVPDELTPDTTEAPEDVTPDNNAGGKQPANTGKYL